METGVAFAGGGIPGIAGVGVLLALEEAGIKVTHVTGTSSGSMVAALYAYGYRPEELVRIVPRLNRRYLDFDWRSILFKALFWRPRLEGWMKGDRLRELMAELTHDAPVSALRLPCGIVATDLYQGETIVFSSRKVEGFPEEQDVSIADAVRSSFSIPVLFRPVYYGRRLLIDGGVSANCPVSICRALGARHVIAVDPISPIADTDVVITSFNVIHKVVHMNLKLQMAHELKHADAVILPQVGKVGVFDFHKGIDCIEAGYKAAVSRIDELKQLLSQERESADVLDKSGKADSHAYSSSIIPGDAVQLSHWASRPDGAAAIADPDHRAGR
ncbi:patatin-like phospholipase family protein [Paenibacillus tarimensis]|uniref:patatin-like phospholipase family protein n=1 Tax=Paenibacillus tarimensis TaxID=416012 RepID=UPI001F3FFA97|nr:patatin-like phospholipase family protein [Paenibacillus tarimensis]MCF2943286.1 patatin-like phospholipase family protein [Paenibacillus tarimensis]